MPSLPGRGLPLVALVVCAAVGAPRVAYAEQLADVDRKLALATEQLATVAAEHDQAQSALSATREDMSVLATGIATVGRGLDATRARVDAIAGWAYQAGPYGQLLAVLVAGSPPQLLDRRAGIVSRAQADLREIASRSDILRRLDADLSAMKQRETLQARHAAELAQHRAELDNEVSVLRQLHDRLAAAAHAATQPPTTAANLPTTTNTTTSSQPTTTADRTPVRTGQRNSSTSDTTVRRSTPAAPRRVGAASTAVAFAHAQLGKPYRWAASGPDAYDCSGLTSAAWRASGVTLPHNAASQYHLVRQVSRVMLVPGDLVFYYPEISHVAIYVGGGSVIHAPTTGDRVRLQRVDYAPVRGYGRPA